MHVIKWLVVGVVFVALLVFCVSNNEVVELRFLTTELALWPIWVVAMAGFAVGFFTMYILSLADHLKLRSRLRKLKREQGALTTELHALRNLPLEEPESGVEGEEGPA
jgi:uncharacterized integral membrane protein